MMAGRPVASHTNSQDGHLIAFANRRRDPETKREAVLLTAVQLFLERSYDRTSLNDVAERLNITKPAIYHYFRNKEDILLECYRVGTGFVEQRIAEIEAAGGTGLSKVEAFIHAYAEVLTIDFGRCVMRLDEGDLSPQAIVDVHKYKRRIDRKLRSFIDEGMRDGSIAPCHSKLAAFAIAGALNWTCMWYEPDGELSAQAIARQFAVTLTRGLAPRPPEPAAAKKRARTGPRSRA
jgi:AcrR family transcriptional regulator